jgi:RNA polymerase sigma-54 factor
MKHSLQLRLSQHLTLTPQLQQSIRLLQLSTLELNQEIEKFLQDNPLLEREDGLREETVAAPPPGNTDFTAPTTPTTTSDTEADTTASDTHGSADTGGFEEDYSHGGTRDDNDEAEYPQVAAEAQSLREHLISQLSLTQISDHDQKLVTLLIDSLNDDGYLHQDLDELAALLPPELDIEVDDLQVALQHLQHLDPPGVGARNLGECLKLQLETLPATTPHRAQALEIVNHHLDVLAARDFLKLKKLLHCEDAALRGVKNLITSLNPRPGASFSSGDTRYIVPDVIVKKLKGVWLAALNPDAMPTFCSATATPGTSSSPASCRRRAGSSRTSSSASTPSCGCRRPSSTASAIFSSMVKSRCGRWSCAKSRIRWTCTNRRSRA